MVSVASIGRVFTTMSLARTFRERLGHRALKRCAFIVTKLDRYRDNKWMSLYINMVSEV